MRSTSAAISGCSAHLRGRRSRPIAGGRPLPLWPPRFAGLLGRQQRVILRYDDLEEVLSFVCADLAPQLSQVGPATPDHLLNTKRLPLFASVQDPADTLALSAALEQALAGYHDRYRRYFEANAGDAMPMLTP